MNANLEKLHKTLDDIANVDTANGIEFWYARELQECLGYARWENFVIAIGRAIDSCKSTGIEPSDHFRDITKMVELGSGAKRGIEDFICR